MTFLCFNGDRHKQESITPMSLCLRGVDFSVSVVWTSVSLWCGLQLQWLFYSCPQSPACKSKLLYLWNLPLPFPRPLSLLRLCSALCQLQEPQIAQDYGAFAWGCIRFLILYNKWPQMQQLKQHIRIMSQFLRGPSLTKPSSQGLPGL